MKALGISNMEKRNLVKVIKLQNDGTGQGEAQGGDANPDKCFVLPGCG